MENIVPLNIVMTPASDFCSWSPYYTYNYHIVKCNFLVTLQGNISERSIEGEVSCHNAQGVGGGL